ncbi:hypothetical protein RJ639_004190 [Escallonia herrerae]|uniref:Mitochondrial transcription termination factor n=1 Tax=Escallonia herrerae TaxID=1293975 RepID=A0AA88W4V3_9ASTE|nr:hypothetical protein RJ639_004190 [Escallonia herrerae]
MTMYLRRTLASLTVKNHHLYKTHISSSFSLLFFSSGFPERQQPKRAVPVADYLLNTHQFSPETAAKAASVLKYVNNPVKSDSILSFLKESGFSMTHLEQMVKNMPKVLSLDLDHTIKPKIKIFQDLGFPPTDIAHIFSTNPLIARASSERLLQSILAFREILGSEEDAFRVLKTFGWLLTHDLKKTMVPNIEFLRSCGICSSQILRHVLVYPRLYLYNQVQFMELVKRVVEMGISTTSKMFLCGIRVVGSMNVEIWERKLQLFRKLGFSEDDILSIFRKMPQTFAVSEMKIKEVTELLLGTGKWDIAYVVIYPALLSYSMEKRLKPRMRVLEILERERLLLKEFNLGTVCMISDIKFFEKYVLPYSDRVSDLSCMFNEGTTTWAIAAGKSP